MNIREFASSLQKLHEEISFTFSTYQTQTKLHCVPGCGRCCFNPDIEATVLEMIPMALALYDEGKLEDWIQKIKTSESSLCVALVPGEKEGEGRCSRYNERPSLCRMFGVAGYLNKNKEITLSVCKTIKNHYGENAIPRNLMEDEAPVMAKWTLKLASLDPALIQGRLPINLALFYALEKVAFTLSYLEENKEK